MPDYFFGTRQGSNRVGFQTRTWSIGNPTITDITPDISGNRRILITDLYAGIIGQANAAVNVSLQITGNSISVTSATQSAGSTTSTGNTYTPPQVTFPITNVTVGNVTGAFSLTSRVFLASNGNATNGNTESTTTTDDIRIALANGTTTYWGGFSYRMVPTAPTATSLTVSGTSFTLNWTAPTSNGSTPITSYVVEHADNQNFTNQTQITGISASSTSRTVTGLSGTRYFRVYAINATGSSQRSNVLNASTVAAPTWSTTTFNQIARVGTNFSATVSAPGATDFTLQTAGTLPSSLTLTAGTGANVGTCTISGPVDAGTSQSFNFRINAINTGGTVLSNTFTITRRQPLPVWTDETLDTTNLRVGTAYTDSVAADNATSYSVVGLPSGGLSHNAGTVSGTPTVSTAISFTISATNSDSESISKAFSLTPKPRLPVWVDQVLTTTTIRVNQSYSDGVSANNATAYALHSGTLPPGITLDTTFGGLTGTPTTAGTYNFVLRARNAIDERIFTNTLTITVQPAAGGRVWNGSTWVQAPFRVWNGSSWVEAPAKVRTTSTAWGDPL